MSEVLSEALKMNGNLQTVYCGAEIGAEQEPNRSRTGADQNSQASDTTMSDGP